MDADSAEVVEAEQMQRALAQRVQVRPLAASPHTIAGLDAAYADDTICAAAALFSLDPLQLLETRTVSQKCAFPYLPGFLFRREAPALLAALGALPTQPDLLLVEGQGMAHPRRCGIASHVGVATGIPSVGCAKTRLVGAYDQPGWEKGSWSQLTDGDVIGAVLRTRSGVKPLYVSVGHLITLEEAVELVLRCCTEFRLPEPLRAADMAARKGLRGLIH